jgi:hypothetical protein
LDWAFLAAALAALPGWALTDDPLSAVLLLTCVDLAGFGPTFRSAYHRPYDEPIVFYLLGTLRNGLAVAALLAVGIGLGALVLSVVRSPVLLLLALLLSAAVSAFLLWNAASGRVLRRFVDGLQPSSLRVAADGQLVKITGVRFFTSSLPTSSFVASQCN